MLRRVFKLLATTFDIWSETNASRNSAAMTYYSMLSLAPLLLISIAIAGIFFCNQQVEQEIVQYFRDIASPEVADKIASMLSNTTSTHSTIWASVISMVVLLYGASGVFTQLFDTINDIWKVPYRQRSGIRFTARKRLIGIAMVLMMGTLLIASLGMGATISYINQLLAGNFPRLSTWLALIDRSLSFFLLPFVLSLMFWYLPMRRMRWPDVWPAAGITAAMLAGSRYLVDFYLRISTASEVYGAAGSLVLFLVWIYLTGQVLFLGACFSRAWTLYFGSESDLTTESSSAVEPVDNPDQRTIEKNTTKTDGQQIDSNSADDMVAQLAGLIVDDVSISVTELPSIRLYQPEPEHKETEKQASEIQTPESVEVVDRSPISEAPSFATKPDKQRSIPQPAIFPFNSGDFQSDQQVIPIIRRRRPTTRKSA